MRAALAWSVETAQLAREHNDANVVSIGARMHTPDVALELVQAFLATPFSGDARHVRRINQLTEFENTGVIPERRLARRRMSSTRYDVPEGHTIHRIARDHREYFAGSGCRE